LRALAVIIATRSVLRLLAAIGWWRGRARAEVEAGGENVGLRQEEWEGEHGGGVDGVAVGAMFDC
jgi:hypothetical protein